MCCDIFMCIRGAYCYNVVWLGCFCFQAEDGIRYLVRSRGLGDVYKRQDHDMTEKRLATRRAQREIQSGALDEVEREKTGWDLSLIHI